MTIPDPIVRELYFVAAYTIIVLAITVAAYLAEEKPWLRVTKNSDRSIE